MKIDLKKLFDNTSFHRLGSEVVLLKGKLERKDLDELKNWLAVIKNKKHPDPVLILDTVGGLADTEVLKSMLTLPLRVHIAGDAQSFGALLALMGSAVTASTSATFMIHRARWRDHKQAEQIAEDKSLLVQQNVEFLSLLMTVLPIDLKGDVLQAFSDDSDTYIDPGVLYDLGVIDEIENYSGEDLGLKGAVADWYDDYYNKGFRNE